MFLVSMGDAAAGYLHHIGRENVGYITYALDLAPACDCVPGSDRSIIPNLGVFSSRDIVAIDMAALDMSVQSQGIPGSAAEEKGVMESGQEKFTNIVGMSQWITPNTCSELGVGSKEYELVLPPVSGNESAFSHPMLKPENPSGHWLGKAMNKFGGWTPPGGYKYRDAPRISIEDLSKR